MSGAAPAPGGDREARDERDPSPGWLDRVRGALRVGWMTGRAGWPRLVAAGAGLWVAVALWVAAAGLAEGVRAELVDGLLRGLPASEVKVEPARRSLGIFELGGGRGGLLGGRPLGEDRLADLRALPGVSAVHPRMMSRFPVSLRAEAMGQSLATDAVLEGIAEEDVAREDGAPREFRWTEGEEVPVLLPEGLLTLFNEGLAPGAGLPRLSPQAVRGLSVTLTLGRSSFGRSPGPPWVLKGRIAGVSRRISAVAAGVPLELVAAAAERFGEGGEPAYSSAVVVAEEAGRAAEVVEAARRMGLQPAAESAFAEQLGRAIGFARAAVAGVGALFAAMAALALLVATGAAARERMPELSLMRSLGASRAQVRTMLVAEATAVGLAGAAAGILCGMALGRGVGGWASGWLEGVLGAEIGALFVPSPAHALGAAAATVALAAAVGWGAARRASRLLE